MNRRDGIRMTQMAPYSMASSTASATSPVESIADLESVYFTPQEPISSQKKSDKRLKKNSGKGMAWNNVFQASILILGLTVVVLLSINLHINMNWQRKHSDTQLTKALERFKEESVSKVSKETSSKVSSGNDHNIQYDILRELKYISSLLNTEGGIRHKSTLAPNKQDEETKSTSEILSNATLVTLQDFVESLKSERFEDLKEELKEVRSTQTNSSSVQRESRSSSIESSLILKKAIEVFKKVLTQSKSNLCNSTMIQNEIFQVQLALLKSRLNCPNFTFDNVKSQFVQSKEKSMFETSNSTVLEIKAAVLEMMDNLSYISSTSKETQDVLSESTSLIRELKLTLSNLSSTLSESRIKFETRDPPKTGNDFVDYSFHYSFINKSLQFLVSKTDAISATLDSVYQRSARHDYRSPRFVCPDGRRKDYDAVGPPGSWNKCYFYKKEPPMTQTAANEFCASINGRLPVIENLEEEEFLRGKVNESFWIGAERTGSEWEGKWVWNKTLPSQRPASLDQMFLPIAKGFWSEDETFDSPCVIHTVNGGWNTTGCQGKRRVICEAQSTNDFVVKSKNKVDEYLGLADQPDFCRKKSCYWISGHRASWKMGDEICKAKGGFLAQIGGPKENEFLAKRLAHLAGVWVGGRCVGRGGGEGQCNWSWDQGQYPMKHSFTDWNTFPVNDVQNRCLIFNSTGNPSHNWKYDYCRKWKNFICEVSEKSRGVYPNVTNLAIENVTNSDDFVSQPACVTLSIRHPAIIIQTKKCFRFVQTQVNARKAKYFCNKAFSGKLPDGTALMANETWFVAAVKTFSSKATWRINEIKGYPKRSSTLTLRGGSTIFEGNVFVNGRPVCDDSWDLNDAKVVCREFGLDAKEATYGSRFGGVPDNFRMDNVKCSGQESRLLSCRYDSDENCDASEGAGVVCYPRPAVPAFKLSSSRIVTSSLEDSTPSWFICQEPDVVKVTNVDS